MHPLSNSNRPEGSSEESGEVGDTKSSAETKQFYKDLISKANTAPLLNIFKYYNIKISEHDKKIICPIPGHVSKYGAGRERTGSLYYYHETNSFWCFGCKTGVKACDFVAAMDSISRTKAAFKIIEICESEVNFDDVEIDQPMNYSERLEILMEFSDLVREFIQSNNSTESSIKYIETMTGAFDKMLNKHKLDNTALRSLLVKIKEKVSNYTSCPQY